jgi:hypothetical protein
MSNKVWFHVDKYTQGTLINTRYVYFDHLIDQVKGTWVQDSLDIDEDLCWFISSYTYIFVTKLNTLNKDLTYIALPQETSSGRNIILVDNTKLLTHDNGQNK